MGFLDKINDIKAIGLLENYNGGNPYIMKFKKKLIKDGKLTLTDNQSKYIVDNHDREPVKIDKIVRISNYLGEELKKSDELSFVPEKILIEYILADNDKTFHIYGKLTRKQEKGKLYWLPKTQVLDDPYFDEIDVSVDFDKYQQLDKNGRVPFEHQKEAIKFLLGRNSSILALDMGLGKVIANDVPVLTPNGWVPHGSLKIGDYVIGSNGKKTMVNGVFPKPLKKYYNITLTDGTVIESCDEHLWAVQTTNHKKRGNGFIVKELRELFNDLTYGTKGNIKWYLPMVKPVDFIGKKTKINPYILGCLLGDGCLLGTSIKFNNNDNEIVKLMSNLLPDSVFLKKIEDNSYLLKTTDNKSNELIKNLKEYELFGCNSENKFIPNDYLYNTIDIRIEILRGLLDTDGYCSKKGTIQYYSTSEKLKNGVKEIVQSLGGIARETFKIGSYKLPTGEKKICKKCFILTINLPENIIPFNLSRKKILMKKNRKYLPSRGIKSIDFSRETYGQCISVDASDSLYVIDKYVVTHNTYSAIIAALESGAKNILIICPSSLKINWEREIKCFCNETAIVEGKKWKRAKFTIINYDILKNFHTIPKARKKKDLTDLIVGNREIVNSNFDLCIIDEAHYIKDPKTIRGKLINDICLKNTIKRVWLLTGTPMANRPMDYFNLLALIKSPIANNWVFYAKRYCDAKRFYKTLKNGKTKQIWITDGASNLDELSNKTRNLVLRRRKEDVLDMPDKIITPLCYELTPSERNEYNELWEAYIEKRKSLGLKVNLQKDLVELILLRKYIAMKAIPKTIELAESCIEQGQKVVIFTNFTDELMELHNYFGKSSVIHYGDYNNAQKQYSVDKFQTDPNVNVFIGNVKSAGVGITLTAGNIVIFNSYDWVPGQNDQCEDRCIFGGQLILTKNGYKKIEDVEIGDYVYTHLGNFKKVTDKHSHLERKKNRVDIDAFGNNKELSVTDDHELYVYNKQNDIFEWVESKNINIRNHYLTLKSNKQPKERKKELDVVNYIKDEFIGSFNVKQKNGRLNILPEKIELTNELLYAFGFFIAEGWSDDSSIDKSSYVSVCQKIDNKKMYDASVKIINIIKKSFGFETHNEYIDKNNVKTCTIYSKNLASNFIEWFGKGVYNKHLPNWVDELNDEQLIHLLNGYYHGDGYNRNSTTEYVTASNLLGSELIRYNANLGRCISSKIIDYDESTHYYGYFNNKTSNLNRNIFKDGYILYPIKSIKISKPKRGEERVYDLTVEDDHSFVVHNYNVHNCHRIGQKLNVTVYYQLFLNSISIRVWETLQTKKAIIAKVIDGKTEIEIMNEIINICDL